MSADAVFIGYVGDEEFGWLALYNVGRDTWSDKTLALKGIPIPPTPSVDEWNGR